MKGTNLLNRSTRLNSLDALRGFNMFWIIGADRLADALGKLHIPGGSFLSDQLTHADWIGFNFYDLIFPLFIYLVGVSLAFSMGKRLEQNESSGLQIRHILIRTLLLFGLGMYMSNSGLNLYGWLHNIRWMGVLQRIALCYGVTAIVMLYIKSRWQAVTVVGLLLGYWVLLRFVPVPIYGAGVWTPQGNFANYIDSVWLPGRLYYGSWDPEGLLSTIPTIALCLMGVLSGHWLRSGSIKGLSLTAMQKAKVLAIAGLVLSAAGLLWGVEFPLIKKIWTSSYIVLSGGLSMLLMALFYWLIDIKGHQKWAFVFVVVGLNSIFIYLAANLVPFDHLANWVVNGIDSLLDVGSWQMVWETLITFLLEWLLLYTMYKRKIFIRI